MLKSYKYRLYPTKTQAELLNKHFDACRFVYNLALETKNRAYKEYGKILTSYDLHKQLTDLKKDCVWLKQTNNAAMQQAISNIDTAFKRFFSGSGYPLFKSKSAKKGSYKIPSGRYISIMGDKVKFPNFTEGVKHIGCGTPVGEIRQATISKTPTGKYFISIMCETGAAKPNKKPILQDTAIGIDLGIKTFAVLSNGKEITNPKYLRASAERMAVLQRRFSRKKMGSANRNKARQKVALLYEKIVNQRKDFLHKLSTNLINNHDTICLETLNVKGMIKNHSLASSISDSSWGEFVRQIKYKAEWYGKNVLQIPTFEPSTKLCSSCGVSNNALTLADRVWTCECGATHDRDVNAAINIKNYCITNSGRGTSDEPVELPTMVGAVKQEILL